jgi:general secretion pathway protein D
MAPSRVPRFSPRRAPRFLPRLLLPCLAAFSACAMQSVAQAPAQPETYKLVAPNADVRDVLQQYAVWVGKRLIYDNQVQGTINIDIPDVSKEEAIRIVEITLMVNGYHLVPVDSDPNLLKVTGLTRSPRQVAVPVLTDPEPIPDNEQVVIYIVKLRYADPTELSQVLLGAMPASKQEYAPHVVALPRAQSLILTENTAVIRQMMRVIRAADLEPTRVEGEWITLTRASAKDVVTMLEKLFEKPQQSPTPIARPATPAAAGAPGGAPQVPVSPAASMTTVEIGGMTEDSMLAGKVRLTADERTNRIYVVSRPVNMPTIRKLIQDFDLDVPFNEPYVRNLKHVNAGDILEALVRAVSDPGTKDSQLPGSTTGGAGARTTTGAQPQAAQSQFGNQFGTGRSATGLQGTTPTMSLQTELRETIPTTVLVGNSRIVADKRGNAIIVIGSADIKEKVNNLLDRLDVRTPQVMLTTIIGELSLGDGQQLGLTYLLGKGTNKTNLSNFMTGGTAALGSAVGIKDNAISLDFKNLLSNTTLRQIVGGGVGGVQGFVTAGDAFGSMLTALESTNKFRVTSRPTIFASNNKRSSLLSGERIAVITGVQSGIGGTTSNLVQQNQVSYIDVNLNLEVVPLINSDKEVHLDIVQTLMERTGESVIDNNKYPIISNRQLQTSVTVPNEGTLVLGGLIKQSRSKTISGIPVLSRAPLIGPLFRSTSSESKRSELVILIRPSVAVDNQDALDVRDRNMKPMQIPVNLEDGLGLGSSINRANASEAPFVKFRSEPPALLPGGETPSTPQPSREETHPGGTAAVQKEAAPTKKQKSGNR